MGIHFNGMFESQVKVAKKTLKVTVGNAGLANATKNCKLLKRVE